MVSTAAMFDYMLDLMTANAPLFHQFGMNMTRAIATILLCWFGLKTALASASGQGAFRLDLFALLVLHIAFVLGMMQFYLSPIPGTHYSFYQLFTKMGEYLATQISNAGTDQLIHEVGRIYFGMDTPILSALINIGEFARIFVLWIVLILAEGLAYGVICFGYIAAAVAVLLGPVFIPFYLFPGMDWIFWGWLKYLLQFSFYPVVANAYFFVFGGMLTRFTAGNPPPYDGAAVLALFGPLFGLLVAFIYGTIKLPSLTNSLFTGRSGEWAAPRF